MIRKAEKKDAALLASAKKDFADAWNEDMINSAFNGGRFFGIINEKEDGFAFVTYSLSVDTADIEDVFVSPVLRRKGLAKELLELAIEDIKAKGKKRVLLEVKDTNFAAIELYSKLGFKKIAVRKKYYSDGDALVLEKEI